MKELLMQTEMALALAKIAYAKMLRAIIIKAIDDPNSDIDESIIKILDIILTYDDKANVQVDN